MYRVMLESILGLTIEGGDTLRLRPRVPDAWPGFRVVLRRPDGTRYEIVVTNPTGDASAVATVSVDGMAGSIRDGVAEVSLARDGASHRVEIRLGAVDSRRRAP
jgi:cyclic beta-1,2-glucan synthetase